MSFYLLILVLLNILDLFLYLDTVCTILAGVKPMVWCLRSHTLPHQYISLLSISASALHTILQRFGMFCPMIYGHFPLLVQKEVENLSLCKNKPTLDSVFFQSFFVLYLACFCFVFSKSFSISLIHVASLDI